MLKKQLRLLYGLKASIVVKYFVYTSDPYLGKNIGEEAQRV